MAASDSTSSSSPIPSRHTENGAGGRPLRAGSNSAILLLIAMVCGLLTATGSARAQETESPAVIAPGSVQIELGWSMARDGEGGTRFESYQVPGTLLRIGLSKVVELNIGWAGAIDEELRLGESTMSVDGVGDAGLGAKLYLREARGRTPEMALFVGTSVPVGDAPFSSDRFDPSLLLLVSHGLGERVGLEYNVGAAFESVRDDATGRASTLSSYIYTLTLGVDLSERLSAFVELFGAIPASASGPPANAFNIGFSYLLRPNVQLDLAAGVGLSDAADDHFMSLLVALSFPG